MKLNKILLAVFVAGLLSSCGNDDISYPDFDYTTVYFASQYPLRTLELGDDSEVDNTLDNEHKVKITATMGGVYSNSEDRVISIKVDESLCDGVSFEDGTDLLPMPANYYNLKSNQITIEAGNILGGVVVELTDAFFEDPLTISQKYVIPVLMTDVVNADSILSGSAIVDNPNRVVSSDWVTVPQDYVLYAVKYVNPWHANYLRRGVDVISDGTGTATDVRHKEYVEYDEIVGISTLSLTECSLPVKIYEDDNLTTRADVELILTFDDNNNCLVSGNSSSYTISGTGKFVTAGEKNSMGGIDRDGLYLDYTVELSDLAYTYTTKDTLVCRDRGIAPEYYNITAEE
ncbi:MAG: adhesin [Bacteroidales bacterium]|nr:MAG: adhesin [Bacteroidales bacterium]